MQHDRPRIIGIDMAKMERKVLHHVNTDQVVDKRIAKHLIAMDTFVFDRNLREFPIKKEK